MRKLLALALCLLTVNAQAAYLGSWKIDDLLTFHAVTHRFDTGVATDADSAPAYRIYEDETTTPLLTGSFVLLDSGNSNGFYSKQVTLSAANGFEKGKLYGILKQATVNSVAGDAVDTFQIEAEVDSNTVTPTVSADMRQVSGDTTAADNAELFFDGTGYAGTNNVIPTVSVLTGHTAQSGDGYAIVNSGTHGNAALKTLIDTLDNFVDTEIATLISMVTGIVPTQGTIGATGNDTTHLHLSGLAYADDAINSMLLTVKDVSTGLFYSRWIEDFVNASDLVTVGTLPFTPEASVDLYWLTPVRADVTGGSGLDAAGVRAAVGLASANLDGQLVAIDDAVDTEVGAIKAKTDNLPADPADESNLTALLTTIDDFLDTEIAGLVSDSDLFDTAAEYCDAIFGCDATSEQVQGTFGQVVGDSAADTDTIWAKTNNLPSDPADESNLTALLTAIDDFIDTEVAAIKAKTDNLPSDPADESNLTALLNAIDDFVDTEVAATLAAVDTEVGAIKAKTDNLPSDPADESNLTALLNAIDDFVDTEVAAIKAKTDGLPSDPADESNLTALLNAIDDFVDTEVAAVKVTTDHLETALELDGAVYRYTTNALEQAPSGAGAADPTVLQTTTIATLASQVSFTLTAGSADNSAYRDCLAIVTDSATAVQKAFGVVSAYTGATKTVTLAADPAIFTMAVGDAISLIAPSGDWDIAIANHLTAGTTGAKLNSAASAGDPLATPVPGAYAAGTAGYVLGNITATLSASGVSVSSPLDVLSQALEITVGDEYTVANGLAPTWNLSGAPSLTGTTVEFRAIRPDGGFYTEMATVVDSDTLRIELVAAETGDVTKLGVPTTWSYHLRILTPFVLTVVQGSMPVFTTPTP